MADCARPDTPERLLDVAEMLFINQGYSSTSMRSITSQAGVNLASVNYHFGSKQGLFEAVVHRRIEPVNRLRLAALEDLYAGTRPLSLRSVLEAFLKPFLLNTLPVNVHRIMGRLFAEPQTFSQALIEREFGDVFERFVGAIGESLPGASQNDIAWRFHFLIGAMIHILMQEQPLKTSKPFSGHQGRFQLLIEYSLPGFEALLDKELLDKELQEKELQDRELLEKDK